MSTFEQELDKRLSKAIQMEKDRQEQLRLIRARLELKVKTKDIIDTVLAVVAGRFKNASTKPTHGKGPSGQIAFQTGIGNYCIIDFIPNDLFGFAVACRLGFEVSINDADAQTVTITSAYAVGPESLKSATPLINALKSDPTSVYSGSFRPELIREAVERRILAVIDAVQERQA
ncbi:MAG: hypothetical protein ACM3ZQ_03125 [Bacillota bacterium]